MNPMNRLASILFIVCSCLSTPLLATEHAKRAFGLNISAADAETLRIALDDVFKGKVNAGSIPGPFETKWTFGMFRIKDVSYSFESSIPQLTLTDSGIALTARLHNFHGQVGRIDLNKAGSRYCENIPASSTSKDIDVNITFNGDIDKDGNFHLHVTSSQVALDRKNFKIAKADKCNALWGFDWIIKRALPKVAQSFQRVISEKLSTAIAKKLEDTGVQYSPYLSMSITLPVNQAPIKPFYAQLSIMPQDIVINKSHFSAWFGSDIEFDPDLEADLLQLDGAQDWPQAKSHVAIAWEFLDAIFKEANTKGLIAGEVTKSTQLDGFFDTKLWDRVWPGVSGLESVGPEVIYELDGANTLKWSRADNTNLAQLAVQGLHVRIKSGDLLIATLAIDTRMNISVDVTSKDQSTFSAAVDSMIIDNVTVDTRDGLVAGRLWSTEGMKQIAILVQDKIRNSPLATRRFINFRAPTLHLGARNIRFAKTEIHPKGLLFPVSLEAQSITP